MTSRELLAAMRAGAVLHMEFTPEGRRYWLTGHTVELSTEVAQRVIDDHDIVRGHDSLFGASDHSQTYVWGA